MWHLVAVDSGWGHMVLSESSHFASSLVVAVVPAVIAIVVSGYVH